MSESCPFLYGPPLSTNSLSGTPCEATAALRVPWKLAASSRATKRAETTFLDLSSMMACR